MRPCHKTPSTTDHGICKDIEDDFGRKWQLELPRHFRTP